MAFSVPTFTREAAGKLNEKRNLARRTANID
jgi:hypothetical protein